jgi:ribulose-phosphate 3-epimerase
VIRICPSILNANFDDLPGEIELVAKVSDLLHLDIMDGIFVPNTTFKFELASKLIETSSIPVDVHLMISEADSGVDPYLSTSALSLSVHLEALSDPRRTLAKIRENGKRASIAIKPGTPIDSIYPYLNQVDMILIMTVEPGFGGQGFKSEMLPKIRQARIWLDKNGFDKTWLQVDGGINVETIRQARVAGADTFVAGSVVYKSEDPAGMVKSLRECAIAE